MKTRKRYQWKTIITIFLILTLLYSGQALCDEFQYDGSQLIEQVAEGAVIPESSLLTGAATYRLPIKVPPGRADMYPKLELIYNSYRGNGIAGVGWDIDISSIQRSKKGEVDYAGTDFEFHTGNSVKELVSVSIDGNGYGTYRPKIEENFSKFTFSSNGWEVVARDGTTYKYGSDSTSRQESGSDIFKWCLDRVEDTNGNFMTYSYWKNQGQIYPQYIEYTGNGSTNPYYQVAFVYETTTRPDPIVSWDTLFSVMTDYRLQYIKTYSDIDGGNDLVNTHTLQYSTATTSPRSRLSSFQVSGPSSETLPPVEFDSRDGGTGEYGDGTSSTVFTQEKSGRFYIAELNGDGLKDFVLYEKTPSHKLYPVICLGDGTFESIDAQDFPSDYQYADYDDIYFADINHDGLSDLLIYKYTSWPTKSHKIYAFLSTGNGCFGSVNETELDYPANKNIAVNTIHFAPVNGDQWTDMIVVDPSNDDTIYIYLSDGEDSGTFTYSSTETIGVTPANGTRRFCDINADGLADIVYTSGMSGPIGGDPKATVYLGEGDGGFSSTPVFSDLPGTDEETKSVHLVDVNGDGLTDLLVRGSSSIENGIFTFLSKGDGYFSQLGFTDNGPSDSYPWYFTDTDADGIADMVRIVTSFGPIGGDGFDTIITYLGSHGFSGSDDGRADLIKEVTNSLGAETTLDYTASIKFQDPEEDPDLPFIVHTLSDITVDDGLGNTSTTTYKYIGGVYDADELDFRGFETVEKKNPDNTTLTTLFNCEDDYLKGKITETLLETSTGTDLEKTTFVWPEPYDLGNYSKFVRLDNKLNEYFDGGVETADIKETYTYDNTNGFMTSKTIAHEGSDGVKYEYIYDNFLDPDGWVWRLTEEIVKDEAIGTKARWVVHDYETGTGNLEETEYVLTSKGHVDNPVITMDYDSYGMLWKQWDAVGNPPTVTLYDTATHSFPAKITNPKGHEVEYTYDYSCGKKDSYTDENDNITYYTYDAFGRLTDIDYPEYPNGGAVDIEYEDYVSSSNPFHIQIDTKENASDWMTTINYLDGLGRKIQSTKEGEGSNNWIVKRMLYDDMGRNYKTAGPFFQTTSSFVTTFPSSPYPYEEVTEYDDRSRPKVVKRPDGQNTWQIVGYAYDGFKTTITDPDNKQKTEERDYLNRIIRIIEHGDSANYHTLYEYNAAGDLRYVSKYDGDENAPLLYLSEMQYDFIGRKTYMDDPDMGQWDYTYDKNNNLKTQTDALDQTVIYEYDELDRSTTIDYPAGTADIEFDYDDLTIENGIGQPYKITRGSVETTYNGYDEMGRLLSETKTIDRVDYTTQFGYDLSGKQVQITYPDSTVVNTSYHQGSGLIDEVYSGSLVYGDLSSYTPSGKIGYIEYFNGADTSWDYDGYSERLTDIVSMDGSATPQKIQERSYTYSPAGDITQIVDAVNVVTYNYGYDKLHRLISETGTGDYYVPQAMVLEYEYNDTNHVNAVTDIKLNGTNYDFDYDDNGNMTDGHDLTDPSDVEDRDLTFNVDNMPTQIVHGDSGTTTILYDGEKKRVKKTNGTNTTKYVNKYYEIINGVATKYIFAGNLRIAKINSSDTWYFHKDHLGSSTVMTNASGNSVETSEYLPYGGQREQSGTSISNYKFTDQELDTETGLYNYDARLYDPVIGRFICADSIVPYLFDPQSLNRYSYCLNNPLIYVDLTGHYSAEWGATFGDEDYDYFDNPEEVGVSDRSLSDEYTKNYIDLWGDDSLYFDGIDIYWIDENGLIHQSYPSKSGGFGDPLPPGPYRGDNLRTRTHPGMTCPDSDSDDPPDGWSLDLTPNFPTKRTHLRVHPDGNLSGTAGCIGTSCGDASDDLYDMLDDYLRDHDFINVNVGYY